MAAVIEVRRIVNRFGSQVVHDGLDLEVRAGEVFCIVGGSGSGKSVLLRTMLGLQRPASGTVRIEGHEVTNQPEQALRAVKRRYGVMFQRGALFSSLTVAQNIELPIREHFPVTQVLASDLAMLRIRMVGLPADAAAKYPAELSGGMTKRVALARALALDPAILFLDEPTSGLDPISAARTPEEPGADGGDDYARSGYHLQGQQPGRRDRRWAHDRRDRRGDREQRTSLDTRILPRRARSRAAWRGR